jgi:spore maturation protein CgeB
MKIAFFGSSLVSAYWNGAATYYRGIIRALSNRGHQITFHEPDAYNRQQHRDLEPPPWAEVIVYGTSDEDALRQVDSVRGADLIVKTSGIGVCDELLEQAVLELQSPVTRVAFWDVDAPATLERVLSNHHDHFLSLISQYDIIFTYGGGPSVIRDYNLLGARRCVPIYNGLDPETHHPLENRRLLADLGFLGNRLPDREDRVERFFIYPAQTLPERQFVLGGNGWNDKALPSNVCRLGHVYTTEHNRFNCTCLAVLNVARESMARYGFSPATRIFEAAGAAACILSDKWDGIEQFFEPGRELLVASDGPEVVELLRELTPETARRIGQAARRRALAKHTYQQRAEAVEAALEEGCFPV